VTLALGEAVRALRGDAKLSQEALGMRAGIHPTWISQIENGRVNPTMSNLFLLSKGLGVRPSELILLTEELERQQHPQSGSGG
jgi:transcriptional regulator with XRE-family HTH domain